MKTSTPPFITQTTDMCCPPFDPSPWDGKVLEWKDKKFITASVHTFFYWPLNFGNVFTKLMSAMDKAGAQMPDNFYLADHVSMWKMNLYVATTADVAGCPSTTMSGKYLCKVYEGPFKDADKWIKDFNNYAKGKGLTVSNQYFWYTTCPKCAKKYGKNYVVLIGTCA